ncbi:hypothetical protein PDJAM_G00202180 [Pangasius djambal]|uniref:Uncharacterized protein n=1 Tax=Pangasius djambal TaxID=1691987 RepID=A0ACC5Y9K7_9TELE|nr:hypothetical protein [Pangasius djambal]
MKMKMPNAQQRRNTMQLCRHTVILALTQVQPEYTVKCGNSIYICAITLQDVIHCLIPIRSGDREGHGRSPFKVFFY